MKRLMTLTVAVCFLFPSLPAMADQAEDEAAITKAEEKYLVVHNAHDAKAVVESYVEDVENWSSSFKGRAAAEKFLAESFAGPNKDSQIKLLDEIGIVFVAPDVAIYKARYEFSGSADEEGPVRVLYAKVY
jgi:ketosteroid isomerase-like protein